MMEKIEKPKFKLGQKVGWTEDSLWHSNIKKEGTIQTKAYSGYMGWGYTMRMPKGKISGVKSETDLIPYKKPKKYWK